MQSHLPKVRRRYSIEIKIQANVQVFIASIYSIKRINYAKKHKIKVE
jgi:hypothetical protein